MNRTFRAEDGTEIAEADLVLAVPLPVRILSAERADAAQRILEALAPKKCSAVMLYCENGRPNQSGHHHRSAGYYSCVLPAGHHPFQFRVSQIQPVASIANFQCLFCDQALKEPIHAPGHMTAEETWSE